MPMDQENPFCGLIMEYIANGCQIYAILSGFPSEKWKKQVRPGPVGLVSSCLWLMWMYTMPIDQENPFFGHIIEYIKLIAARFLQF